MRASLPLPADIPAASGERLLALDTIRGVAVMGILLMNIVAFAMPEAAYTNPAAYGTHVAADWLVWAAHFAAVDGRMRGLFSFLFGASLLLVAERAEASGRSAARVHYARMAWLFVFGMAHLAFVWWGDILHHYALVGCIAFLFRRLPPEKLVVLAMILLAFEFALLAGLPPAIEAATAAMLHPHPAWPTVEAFTSWRAAFGRPGPVAIAHDLALHRGGYAAILQDRFTDVRTLPLQTLTSVGPETLAYMLLGMACLRAGLFSGGWSRAALRRWLWLGFGIGLPCFAALGWIVAREGFAMPAVAWGVVVLTVPLRPLMIMGWAALILLALRPGGALTRRLAATGRMAFTNYLGCSIAGTTLFYGYGAGRYGHLSRWQLMPVVLAFWLVMLLASPAWLGRYRFGPMEWLWRSLARGRLQPMRRTDVANATQ